jgi:hypothetical protein
VKRKPQKRFQYPRKVAETIRGQMILTIRGYDMAIRAWIDGGRVGPRPVR